MDDVVLVHELKALCHLEDGILAELFGVRVSSLNKACHRATFHEFIEGKDVSFPGQNVNQVDNVLTAECSDDIGLIKDFQAMPCRLVVNKL